MPKQFGYELSEEFYLHGFVDALIWFLERKNKHCREFCPKCNYFFKCQDDMMREWLNKE